MIPEIDKEWTEFLEKCPETSLPIKIENLLYEKAKNKWYVKMSLKYGFSVDELKQRYGKG